MPTTLLPAIVTARRLAEQAAQCASLRDEAATIRQEAAARRAAAPAADASPEDDSDYQAAVTAATNRLLADMNLTPEGKEIDAD